MGSYTCEQCLKSEDISVLLNPAKSSERITLYILFEGAAYRYTLPGLIMHQIEEHSYLPSPEFIRLFMAGTLFVANPEQLARLTLFSRTAGYKEDAWIGTPPSNFATHLQRAIDEARKAGQVQVIRG